MANNEKKRMLLLLSHTSVLSDNFQKETTENVPRDLIDGMAPLLLKNHNDMYNKVIHLLDTISEFFRNFCIKPGLIE